MANYECRKNQVLTIQVCQTVALCDCPRATIWDCQNNTDEWMYSYLKTTTKSCLQEQAQVYLSAWVTMISATQAKTRWREHNWKYLEALA